MKSNAYINGYLEGYMSKQAGGYASEADKAKGITTTMPGEGRIINPTYPTPKPDPKPVEPPKKDSVTVVPDPAPLLKGGDKAEVIKDAATGKPVGQYIPDKK